MSLAIPPGTYGIDPVHSQLGFAIRHLGISTIRGTFDRFSGSLTIGEELSDTSISVEADMSSLNTGFAMRDEHIHGPDFFDLPNHPTMTFQSTSVAASGDGFALNGDLTIKGVTLPITFATTYNGSEVFPVDGSTHYGFSASADVIRTAFNMPTLIPVLSDEVTLELEAQFVQPAG
jgi:polyisoprenoid-binding protein YceI